jgi:hypothetical protein
MTATRLEPTPQQAARSKRAKLPPGASPVNASVLDEARSAGLLDGDRTEHVSFRAPPGLVEAAKRESGINSTSELGLLALAMLARPDPVAAFFRCTEGSLGPDHDLEY